MEKLKKKPKNKSTITNDIPSAPTLDDFHVDPEATVTSLILPRTTEDVQPPSCPPLEDEEETCFTTEHFFEHEASAPLQDNLVLRRISEQRPEHLHSSIHKELNTMNPYINLSSSLTQMSPHQHLQGDLQYLDLEDKEVTTEVLDTNLNIDRGSDQLVIEQPSIVPFTESQLHALYHNAELEKNLEFVEHWLETQREIEKFPLDELLVNYLRVRTNLNSCGAIYDRGRSQVDDLIGELWQFSSDKIEEEGECDDENIVIVKREAKVATFNKSAGESLKNQFKECKETLVDNNSLFSFRSEVLRLKIEEFINSVIVRHQGMIVERPLVYSCEQEVRLTISVLFKFVRKDVEDKKFIRDLRGWLDQMIGLTLAQSATLYEHLFLLNHIMRCPAGVGRWAAHYIQPAIPITDLEETSFDNPFLDHLITLLATILLPVKERLNFLHEFRIRAKRHVEEGEDEGEEGDKIWVVLDGEGSEDEDPKESWGQLRESDLIALFNQIPVDHMFRYVLRIEERDGTDQYNVKHSIQHSFLKLYAFSTQFVFLLREGLKTFNTPKYRQFAKRLGRLIRHTVHYVSDHWEGFRAENHNSLDPSMLIRLQVEYDNFFLRAAQCIFSSQKLGTWQFLADIPFSTISANMLWRIFYVLHLDYHEESHKGFGHDIEDWSSALASQDLQLQFEEKCAEAGETEVYFLLSAFANMATSRGVEDRIFIERATLDLFDVGFVCESTRETCSKNCRDLLVSVCVRHSFILSTLIQVLRERVNQVGKLCGYLFQALPWVLWRPDLIDMNQVYAWLQMPAPSIESHLARTILSAMNWEHGILSTNIHIATCINVVETNFKQSPDSGMTNNSMVTMTNLALVSMTSLASSELQFTTWSWETVSRLHLHMLDRGPAEAQALLGGDANIFSQLLDYDLDQQLEGLVAAAVSKHPLACYSSLLLTQLGHSLPEILERGLALAKTVLDAGRMDHVMELLSYITPIFLNDLTSIENEHFKACLVKLLSADQTYLSLAKSMITGAFPGPVTSELGNMTEKVISNHLKYGLDSPKPIVMLWMKILTSLPNWNSNNSSLFLFDILCCHAFPDPTIHADTLEFVQSLHRKYLCDINSGGLINWITGINYSGLKLLFTTSLPQFPWMAYFFLQAEDSHCRVSGLWPALVSQLGHQRTLEDALPAAASQCEISQPPLASQLPLYRWLQQAMDTSPDHPIHLIFWQRFFQLFLSRPQPKGQGEETRGVGMSFFQGMLNTLFFNKVKSTLSSCQDHYRSRKDDDGLNNCDNLIKIYKTLFMWLDEAKVLDSTLYIPALSPMYEPERLAKVLAGDTSLWLELINLKDAQVEHRHAYDEWDRLHFRQISGGNGVHIKCLSRESQKTPSERILKRLQSYEPHFPGPIFKNQDPPIPHIPLSTLQSEELLIQALAEPLSILGNFADQFHCNSMAFGSLNCSYIELAPSLWIEEEVETFVKQPCSGVQQGKHKFECSGPAKIQFQYFEARKDETIDCKLETNRKEWAVVESRLLATPCLKYIVATAVLNNISHRLLMLYEKDLRKGHAQSYNHNLGLVLFYQVAKAVSEDWLTCPSLRHFVSDYLETLASVMVSGTSGQAPKLLELLVQCPHLSPFLSPHFSPNVQDHNEVVNIYKQLSGLPDGDGALTFVLLSKLDVQGWLRSGPSVEVRTTVVHTIGRALGKTGHDPEPIREMLHGLHRRHLFQFIVSDRRGHYLQILQMLLALSELNQLDPNLWVDILNCLTNSPGKFSLEYQDREERLACVINYVNMATEEIYNEEIISAITELTTHFHKERLQFGLYGLYPKYRSYVEPLAAYFSLLGLLLFKKNLRRGSGRLDPSHLEEAWIMVENLYGPWIFPLNPSARSSTATWIQQLTEESSCLPPWIPGDSVSATTMLSSFLHCVRELLNLEDPHIKSCVLSKIWRMYSTHWAQPAVKDHVLGVVHSVFNSLPWSGFVPNQPDIDLMVRVMSSFVPTCHAFLGNIFVQVDWRILIETPVYQHHLFPSLLSLLVKLSAEPSVRKAGVILSLLNEAESWGWVSINLAHYQDLAQWFVMSIDCKCIVKHSERSPVDESLLRLFRSAAGFSMSGDLGDTKTSVAKQKVWVKCIAKLLSSCGSKQRNFLSHNQPALHTTLRKVLEDISLVSNIDKHSSTGLVKDYLTILNSSSNSVLPGSALMVLQSWLTNQCGRSTVLHAFLNQGGMAINETKMSCSVLESVLEASFREKQDDDELSPCWNRVLDHISWPSGVRTQQVLDQATSGGHLLLLYAYIRYKRPSCVSLSEEKVLVTSTLDWLRHLPAQQASSLGVEPKLALLYRQVIVLLQRQATYGDQQGSQIWLIGALNQFCDVLMVIADSSPGWSQNILGAIGLSSNSAISQKGKFLARSLYLFIRVLMNVDKTGLLEKSLDEESALTLGRVIACQEVKPHIEKIIGLKTNKAFAGIYDLIDWTITQIRDETNTLMDAHLFLDQLVVNKLYVELYLKP